MSLRRVALAAASLIATIVIAAAPARADQVPTLTPENAKLASEYPIIELVTMGVGGLIWERHGHIALCVRYQNPADDACYNYGIGDFHHPLKMAWGFLRGTGAFWVGRSPPRSMLEIYIYADRTVWSQPLPLTQEQKRKVIAKLEFDILEPNRYYAYDHFWDNCTTRVRDVIDAAIGGQLSAMNPPTDGREFRALAREGFYGMRIPLLITDIAMGRATDRKPTYYERMFLPEYLREAVVTLWGVQPKVRYERKGPPSLHDGPSGRVLFALVIVGLTAPAWLAWLFGRRERLGAAIAIAPYVLLGAVLTFLAVISPLPYVKWNETCLVWFPLDVLAVALAPARRVLYARARLVMLGLVALLLIVDVLHQPLWAPLLWPAIPLAVVAFWRDRSRTGPIDARSAIVGG